MAEKKKLGYVYRMMINRLVKPPKMGEVSRFWPRETKLAKELYAKFPNEDFWGKVSFDFELNSLAGLKFEHSFSVLSAKYQQFMTPAPEIKPKIEIFEGKFGESVYNGVKQSTFLKDLLK